MRNRIAAFLLLMAVGVPAVRAQVDAPAGRGAAAESEETVDSTETVTTETDPSGVVTTSTTSRTTFTLTSNGTPAASTQTSAPVPQQERPAWINLVKIAAQAGPPAFLLLAWIIGALVHVRLVRREQDQFPLMRGSRTPQTTPMLISGALFFIPAVLFILFEIRSRHEISRGIGGVVDEWLPVTRGAWALLLVCLVLALVPWLFARRADTVAEGRN